MKLLIHSFALSLALILTADARPTSDDPTVHFLSSDSLESNEIVLQSDNLYGWKGCSTADRSSILQAVRDSQNTLSIRTVHDFADWGQTTDAFQLFGQAVANDYHGWSSMVQQNFRNAYDFAAGSSGEKIQVFCHDQAMSGPLEDECASRRQPDPVVVTRSYLGREGPAFMFCDSWFQMQTLSSAKEIAAIDLDGAENQARAMITALMLVPSIAPWPSDHHGASMIYRKQTLPGDNVQRYVTSAAACKQLAAIQDANLRRTILNADTYSWYALSAYFRESNQRR